MNTRTAACTALIALAALTAGCSSGDEPSKSDKPTQTATAAPTPTVDAAAARQACVDAVAAIPAGDNGEVPSEPIPADCEALTDSEYLDAYMDGIEQSNEEGRDALQDLIDEASENAQP